MSWIDFTNGWAIVLVGTITVGFYWAVLRGILSRPKPPRATTRAPEPTDVDADPNEYQAH